MLRVIGYIRDGNLYQSYDVGYIDRSDHEQVTFHCSCSEEIWNKAIDFVKEGSVKFPKENPKRKFRKISNSSKTPVSVTTMPWRDMKKCKVYDETFKVLGSTRLERHEWFGEIFDAVADGLEPRGKLLNKYMLYV
jgi:hypothetical protein